VNEKYKILAMTNDIIKNTAVHQISALSTDRAERRIFYQPQIDSLSGRMVGVEALIRWEEIDYEVDRAATKHWPPRVQPLYPWFIGQACAETTRWQNSEGLHPTLLVNILPRQLLANGFLDIMLTILAQTQYNPSRLTLKLTKTNLSQNFAALMPVVTQLQNWGVSIALNDQTGSISGRSLQILPIDCLQLDRHFVQQIASNPEIESQFYTIVNQAKSLDINLIAAGVETTDQIEFLAWHGCRVLQGDWYSPPRSGAALQKWLRRSGR
jgi:EAL domain-containing protein (putative c-di-GMP-specific phosphodiesterase class I)